MNIKRFVYNALTISAATAIAAAFIGCGNVAVPTGKVEPPVDPPSTVQPAEPVTPTEPTEPSKPSEPSEPETPAEPTIPTEPVEPEKPVDPPAWALRRELPNADDAMQKLTDIYGGADKVFLLQANRIARMPCPDDGEVVTFDMTYEVNGYTKLILEDCVAEFNDVFGEINPNYTFKINYAPNESDFAAEYSVRMTHAQTLKDTESSSVFGLAHISYGNDFTTLSDFGITLKDEVLTDGRYLMTTFKHEVMHLLGAGDAYKKSEYTKATVMQSYTVNGYHNLSRTDVAFLDALYRNPAFDGEADDARINNFIAGYEASTPHTKDNMTAAVYYSAVLNADASALTEQAEAIGYKDVSGLAATIKDGLRPDPEFGKSDVGFTELEYAVRPEETYFGAFDADDPKNGYTHGRDKGSLQSSMGIWYTNYGNGILYSYPNGTANKTLFVKTGDYVLLLHFDYGFTDLDKIELTLWHACMINGRSA